MDVASGEAFLAYVEREGKVLTLLSAFGDSGIREELLYIRICVCVCVFLLYIAAVMLNL